MASQNTVKRILIEFQKLKKENEEYKQIAKNQINFNRKLCSENRKRRLANNQLKKQEQDRIIELQMAKGSTLELKKLIKNLQMALEEKDKQNLDWEDEVLVLRTDITKLNQKLSQITDNCKSLEIKYKEKCKEFDVLFKNSYRESKTSKITPKDGDFDDQLMGLINQNCELEGKIKDMKETINAYHEKISRMELNIKEMLEEIESKDQIICILSQQDISKQNNVNFQSTKQEITPFETLLKQILSYDTKKEEKINKVDKVDKSKTQQGWGQEEQKTQKTPIYQNLRVKAQQYCQDYEHLLYSNTNIENLSEDGVSVNYCQVIQTKVEGVWKSRIKIASEGQLYFGVADARFNYIEVMRPVRNFVYYNNCTGAVVVNKDGKLTEQYAHKGDFLQIQISLRSNKKEIVFARNNKPFFNLPYPQIFKNSEKLYLFIKLFRFMAVDLF